MLNSDKITCVYYSNKIQDYSRNAIFYRLCYMGENNFSKLMIDKNFEKKNNYFKFKHKPGYIKL